jgi:hypothetical protein
MVHPELPPIARASDTLSKWEIPVRPTVLNMGYVAEEPKPQKIIEGIFAGAGFNAVERKDGLWIVNDYTSEEGGYCWWHVNGLRIQPEDPNNEKEGKTGPDALHLYRNTHLVLENGILWLREKNASPNNPGIPCEIKGSELNMAQDSGELLRSFAKDIKVDVLNFFGKKILGAMFNKLTYTKPIPLYKKPGKLYIEGKEIIIKRERFMADFVDFLYLVNEGEERLVVLDEHDRLYFVANEDDYLKNYFAHAKILAGPVTPGDLVIKAGDDSKRQYCMPLNGSPPLGRFARTPV